MKLKKFVVRGISLILCGLIKTLFACSGNDCEGGDYFFDPYVIHDSSVTSLFRDPCYPLFNCTNSSGNVDVFKEQNSAEWRGFFKNAITEKPLTYMLYKSTTKQIDSAIFIMKKTMSPPPNQEIYGSFLKYDNPSNVIEFLYYVGFARRCEPWVAAVPDWNDTPDSAKINSETGKLLTAAQVQLPNVKAPFIYERYLFQIIRLFFKANRYEECIAFYDKHVKNFSTSPSMCYRSQAYVAGAYYRLGNYSEANVRFAQIYDRYPPLRCMAGYSFHPQSGYDWDKTISKAKEDRTREVLSLLLGLYGNPIDAMKEIYSINPSSDQFNLLCVRTINTMEEGIKYPFTGEPIDVNEELLDFILKATNEGQTNKPWVWNLAAGHLLAFQGKPDKAEKYLQKAARSRKEDSVVQTQVNVSSFIGYINALAGITPETEEVLYNKMKLLLTLNEKTSSKTIYLVLDLARQKIATFYSAHGDPVKAECFVSNDSFYLSNSNIDKLIFLLDKKNKNNFESLITGPRFIAAETSIERQDLAGLKRC